MRIQKKVRVFLAAIAIGMTSVSAAHAIGPVGLARPNPFVSHMNRVPTGQNALAPFAYILFCAQNPGDCAEAQPAVVRWSGRAERLIGQVNRRVNRTIQPVNDRSETWSADVKAGDCEDFALTKRRELIRHGIPASALRMAVVVTPNGAGHAVLVVSTSRGDLVLDNRNNRILAPQKTDLTFIKIASAENPRIWLAATDRPMQNMDVADVERPQVISKPRHARRAFSRMSLR